MEELRDHALGEALASVLRTAVRGLQRDAPVGHRRAHLHDRAPIALHHAFERGVGTPHHAQVGHLGRPRELLGLDLKELRIHGHHGVVDPHVDRPEGLLHGLRGGLDAVRIGHIERQHQRLATGLLDLPRRCLEPLASAGDQADTRPIGGEPPGARAPHTA